ncbi:MAG: alpha/beta fold hydrolase [Sandaracinaceae bacterium]|nr:alpha/beta fold hydrolase [Sandaracinaceae bacterium]
MNVAYLHGFASSPLSKKGLALKAALAAHGRTLQLPDLNAPSFAQLSLRSMLGVLDRLDRGAPWSFVGSSLGGWLAARWAELHPERVERLVLLCPAFDLSERWPSLLPPGALELWRSQGYLQFPDAAGVPTPVHYALYEESLRERGRPVVPCPTLVIHGRRDERVPIESSRAYARSHSQVELLELDDDHEMIASTERIAREALAFLRVDTHGADP